VRRDRHQGEALDFMCKREIGGAFMENDLRFWHLDRNEDAMPV
jgi:SWI/SNF-related matrix-associated actin-dependent regulator of chromatin subfamily A3